MGAGVIEPDVAAAGSTWGGPPRERILRAYQRLTPAERALADHLLAHADRAVELPIDGVAREARVGASVVSRFSRRIGYDSFRALRLALARETRGPAGRGGDAVRVADAALGEVADAAWEAMRLAVLDDVAALDLNLRSLDPASVRRAAELIAQSRRVVTIGFGTSAAVAQRVASMLLRHGWQARAEAEPINDAWRGDLEVGDLVVAITHRGRVTRMVAAIPDIRQKGARLVVLTNAPGSAMARGADVAVVTCVIGEDTDASYALGPAFPVQLVTARALVAAALAVRRSTGAPSGGSDAPAAEALLNHLKKGERNAGAEDAPRPIEQNQEGLIARHVWCTSVKLVSVVARRAEGRTMGMTGAGTWQKRARRTRRRLLATVPTVALLAACGQQAGGNSGAGGAPATPSKLAGKLVLLARGNEVELSGQRDILIPAFKQAAPEVEVFHEVVTGGTGPYNEKLITMWTGGSPPDVFGFGMNYMAYWARGMVADLTPLLTRDKFDMDQFMPGLADKFKVKGKQYGLPQQTTFGTLLFYNKQLFDAAGIKHPPVDWEDRTWTLDAMMDAARKLTKNAGTSEAVYGLSYAPQLPTQPVWQFGGDAFRPEHYTDGIAQSSLLDSAPSIAGHELYQDVAWREHVSPQTGKDPSVGDFTRGRIAMLVQGGYNLWSFTTIKDFAWGAAALPAKTSNKNVNYNDFWELAKGAQNPEAGWAFLTAVTSPDAQQRYSQLTGTPPTTKGAADAWYGRYEAIMPRAQLEKLTQGAIDPKRSQESPDHLFIDWSRFDEYYKREVRDPINRNEGRPREIITRAKPGYDALMLDVYNSWKGKTPD